MSSKVVVFTHSRLSGVHHGIQALHATVELLRKYDEYSHSFSSKYKQVVKWADVYKTIWLVDGGRTPDLNKLKKMLQRYNKVGRDRNVPDLPWAEFREPDMGNMITAIAVVVPDEFHPIPGAFGRKLYELIKNAELVKG